MLSIFILSPIDLIPIFGKKYPYLIYYLGTKTPLNTLLFCFQFAVLNVISEPRVSDVLLPESPSAVNYKLILTTNLEEETFSGSVIMTLTNTDETELKTTTLHAKQLDIKEDTIKINENQNPTRLGYDRERWVKDSRAADENYDTNRLIDVRTCVAIDDTLFSCKFFNANFASIKCSTFYFLYFFAKKHYI